jgi:uncharacterized membrane protein
MATPHRLSILAEICLVLVCWSVAIVSGLSLISCIGENKSEIERVCYSMTAQTVYEAIVIAAAAIPLFAVIASHLSDRRHIAQLGCLLSFALVGTAVLYGFKTGAHPAYPPPEFPQP